MSCFNNIPIYILLLSNFVPSWNNTKLTMEKSLLNLILIKKSRNVRLIVILIRSDISVILIRFPNYDTIFILGVSIFIYT